MQPDHCHQVDGVPLSRVAPPSSDCLLKIYEHVDVAWVELFESALDRGPVAISDPLPSNRGHAPTPDDSLKHCFPCDDGGFAASNGVSVQRPARCSEGLGDRPHAFTLR